MTTTATDAATTYRRVLAEPGFLRLAGGALIARTGQQMATVALVLFVLSRYASPGLAGLVVFLLLGPGLVIAPLAGALLDRHGRIRLITLDYAVGAVVLAAIALLDRVSLPAGLLCILAVASSITYPLSNTGTRSLYPLLLPRRLWDRANAIDSAGFVVAMVAGPALAGALVALLGPGVAVGVTAAVYLAAALVVAGAPEPDVGGDARGILRDARDGVAFVVRSRSLRGLAVCLCVYNLGAGAIVVALPLLVLGRFGGGSAEVGALFALQGVGGLTGALLAGRGNSEGRERQHIAGGMLLSAVAFLVVMASPVAAVAAVGMVLFGGSNGPIDIGLFSLRQRRCPPEWVGRAFAVSMALNFCGYPIGSALGGPVAGRSLSLALALAAIAAAAGAATAWWLIPARWEAEERAAVPCP